jgi:hypothetical protein
MTATARAESRAVTPATTTEAIAQLVIEAALDGGCLILTYVNSVGAVTARGCWPVITQRHPNEPIWVTAQGERCFSGYDSLRDMVISYRLDRVVDAHRLEA